MNIKFVLFFASGIAAAAQGFEKNLGQTDPQVRYLLRSRDVSVFLTDRETVFRTSSGSSILMESAGKPVADSVASSTITSFVGPRERWREDVPVFDRIRRRDVFPGIDLVHYGAEYDYVIAPGANPRAIAVRFRGQKSLRIDETGALVFNGDLRHERPVAYQKDSQGNKTLVDAWFQLQGDVVTFGVGDYDRSRELVIDPEFEAVRFRGGSGDDVVLAQTYRWTVGNTTSIDFPLSTTEARGQSDVFVETLGRQYYFGGSGQDVALTVQPFSTGFVVAGVTSSHDFPVTPRTVLHSSFQGGETDGFVISFVYEVAIGGLGYRFVPVSGYWGGSGNDRVTAAAYPYLFGETDSVDLAVSEDAWRRDPARVMAFRLDQPYASYFDIAPVHAAVTDDSNRNVFAADVEGRVISIDGRVNRILRQAVTGEPIHAIALASGWGIATCGNGYVSRLDRETLETLQRFPVEGDTHALVTRHNYAIVSGNHEGDVFVEAIDLETGESRWRGTIGGPGEEFATSLDLPTYNTTLTVLGTTNAPWGQNAGYGGKDTFVATVQLPLLTGLDRIPSALGKDLTFSVFEPSVSLVSSSADVLRVSAPEGNRRSVAALADSGFAVLTASRQGYWNSKFRVNLRRSLFGFLSEPEVMTPWRSSSSVMIGLSTEGAESLYGEQLRPDLPPLRYRLRTGDPTVATVSPESGVFETSAAPSVYARLDAVAKGVTDLVLEADGPIPVGKGRVRVEASGSPASGAVTCIAARGFVVANRSQSATPLTIRSLRPGELQFALDGGPFQDSITIPPYAGIQIAASLDASDDASVVAGDGRIAAVCQFLAPALPTSPGAVRLEDKERRRIALPSAEQWMEVRPARPDASHVSTSDPSVVEASVLDVSTLELQAKSEGSAEVSVSIDGAAGRYVVAVTVRNGRVISTAPVIRVGANLQTRITVTGIEAQRPATLDSLDPSKFLLSTSPQNVGSPRITVRAGEEVWIQAMEGTAGGTATLALSGDGYAAAESRVEIHRSFAGLLCSTATEFIVWTSPGQAFSCLAGYYAVFPVESFTLTNGTTLRPVVAQRLRPSVAAARLQITADDPQTIEIATPQVELNGPEQTPVLFRVGKLGATNLRVFVTGFESLPRANLIPTTLSSIPGN